MKKLNSFSIVLGLSLCISSSSAILLACNSSASTDKCTDYAVNDIHTGKRFTFTDLDRQYNIGDTINGKYLVLEVLTHTNKGNTTTYAWHIDMPEETPAEGDTLSVLSITDDTIHLGYLH